MSRRRRLTEALLSSTLRDAALLLHVRDGALDRHDPLSVALRPELGELRAEEHDHRRVVDPDQHERERARRAVDAARIGGAGVETDQGAAENEPERGADGARPNVAPADARVGQIAEHHREEQRDDEEAADRRRDLEQHGRDAELRGERVADRGDHGAERERDEQQERDGDEDAEREHALHEEDADLIAARVGLTPHALLSAFWRPAKRPVAPRMSTMSDTIVAMEAASWERLALPMIAATCAAPAAPIKSLTSPTMAPCTCCGSANRPTSDRIRVSSAGSERKVLNESAPAMVEQPSLKNAKTVAQSSPRKPLIVATMPGLRISWPASRAWETSSSERLSTSSCPGRAV